MSKSADAQNVFSWLDFKHVDATAYKLARQMECFLNPVNLSHMSIC